MIHVHNSAGNEPPHFCLDGELMRKHGVLTGFALSTIVPGVLFAGLVTQAPSPGTAVASLPTELSRPQGLALDGAGNLYVTDFFAGRVVKIAPDGSFKVVVGNGQRGYRGDGGPAISAQLNAPSSVSVDAAGSLYIAQHGNGSRVRKVTADGVIQAAISAQLRDPSGIAIDAAGNLYIADTGNHRVRKLTTDGVITTVAGIGNSGLSGDGGAAVSARLNLPVSVAVDTRGNLYIADAGNHSVRKVTPGGNITTIAGNGSPGFKGDGGPAASAQLHTPSGLVVDAAGNLYIADTGNNRVRKVTPTGLISTVAGSVYAGFGGDGGPAISGQLNSPKGLAIDTAATLYIADSENFRIRKVSNGVISTAVSLRPTVPPTVAGPGGRDQIGNAAEVVPNPPLLPLRIPVPGPVGPSVGNSTSAQRGVAFNPGGGVSEPVILTQVQPEYTKEARDAKIQGTVELLVIVNRDGTVKVDSVKKSLGYGMDEKAIEAVQKWKFMPGKKDGEPVPTYVTILVNFSLPR
jgi:TonB family protein